MTTLHLIKIIRWTARLGSIASIGLLLAFLLGEGEWPLQLSLSEGLGIMLFPGGVIAGMVIGWWREGMGGLIAIASLVAFYLEQVIIGHGAPQGPWFLIFALPGLLFMLYWVLSRNGSNRQQPPTYHAPA